MAKRKKAKKLKKALAASYRKLAAQLLEKLERDQPADRRRVSFLVHDDAAVELAESQKYAWVDAKVLVRVKRVKRETPALATVPTAEATA